MKFTLLWSCLGRLYNTCSFRSRKTSSNCKGMCCVMWILCHCQALFPYGCARGSCIPNRASLYLNGVSFFYSSVLFAPKGWLFTCDYLLYLCAKNVDKPICVCTCQSRGVFHKATHRKIKEFCAIWWSLESGSLKRIWNTNNQSDYAWMFSDSIGLKKIEKFDNKPHIQFEFRQKHNFPA